MFVDKVQVQVHAGDGGDGAVSFRQEKFVDKGGPDGGNGGNGGNVLVRASRNQNTLASFRYQKLLKAEPGQAGSKRKKNGRRGQDLVVDLPVGTVITNDEGEVVADLAQDGQTQVLMQGGKGGFGNAHFVSSTRQAPRVAEKGERIKPKEYEFELKMIADVGLIGLPNAGKSTLLSVVSNARPLVADYPFTTLTPNLGVVDIDDSSVLFADIPGLIEGASQGKGLGDEFLRHIERTKVLVHIVDIYNKDLKSAYETILHELKSYNPALLKKPQIIVLNKVEGLDKQIIDQAIKELKVHTKSKYQILAISTMAKQGLNDLLYKVAKIVKEADEQALPAVKSSEPEVVVLKNAEDTWSVTKIDEGFVVSGKKIEQFAGRTDYANPQGIQRLKDIMKKMGIMHELERKAVRPGDSIFIGDYKITY